ncbi:hypothetical protein NDU88_000723 [Pleurodeles waltl]|uniref:Uncharacterized protein n=1 Tax=Pleurodeles waltl TaxID=8319 RepID=A0AAV7U567_PLEWA|nr:hypothetical protein NDU88_000723 [Pleurodeles waltl]
MACRKMQIQIRRVAKTCSEFTTRMEEAETRISRLEDEAGARQSSREMMEKQLEDNQWKLTDLEDRMRRNNLRVLGGAIRPEPRCAEIDEKAADAGAGAPQAAYSWGNRDASRPPRRLDGTAPGQEGSPFLSALTECYSGTDTRGPAPSTDSRMVRLRDTRR